MLRSKIKVMRPDLLQKQQGVSELFRNTLVKAIMRGDGTFLVMWAGRRQASGVQTQPLHLSPWQWVRLLIWCSLHGAVFPWHKVWAVMVQLMR